MSHLKEEIDLKGEVKLPTLTAEERIRAKGPSDWDVIYGSMTPFEKGQWNAEKRKEKLQKQKEEAEEKKQKRIANHTKRQWGIPDQKLTDLPIIKGNIKYQKMHNQDLKSNMRKWIFIFGFVSLTILVDQGDDSLFFFKM